MTLIKEILSLPCKLFEVIEQLITQLPECVQVMLLICLGMFMLFLANRIGKPKKINSKPMKGGNK